MTEQELTEEELGKLIELLRKLKAVEGCEAQMCIDHVMAYVDSLLG